MPAPYKRSCENCVRAKRRCDLDRPCCRCRVRKLSCSYSGVRGGIESGPNNAVNHSDVTSGGATAYPDHDLDWSDLMTNLEEFVVPDNLIEANVAITRPVLAGTSYQQRVVYATQRFKSWPELFARTAHTPFIHTHLYLDHPRPCDIDKAMAMCSLFSQKNKQNQDMVHRCLSSAANELSSRMVVLDMPSIALLSTIQALCLYQIMQLFDGDIGLRHQAETRAPLLRQYLALLRRHAIPSRTGEAALVARGRNVLDSGEKFWKSWLLEESIRRTLMIGYSIGSLYDFLKQNYDDADRDFADLSFTSQRVLWEKRSSYSFEIAFDKHSHGRSTFPVHFSTFDEDVQGLQGEDLDELTMIMIALVKGVEYCCHRFGESVAVKFGLTTGELSP